MFDFVFINVNKTIFVCYSHYNHELWHGSIYNKKNKPIITRSDCKQINCSANNKIIPRVAALLHKNNVSLSINHLPHSSLEADVAFLDKLSSDFIILHQDQNWICFICKSWPCYHRKQVSALSSHFKHSDFRAVVVWHYVVLVDGKPECSIFYIVLYLLKRSTGNNNKNFVTLIT